MPDLVTAIDELLSSTEPRKDIGRPRLAIDRVFTIVGSGTVITGTLIDSSLSTGQEVEIVPPGLKSRVRGLQTHKTRVNTASIGNRVAVNLVGIATSQLKRGDVQEVIVRGEQGYGVMVSAGRGVLLLVVANERAKLGLIFFDMRSAINAIKRVL